MLMIAELHCYKDAFRALFVLGTLQFPSQVPCVIELHFKKLILCPLSAVSLVFLDYIHNFQEIHQDIMKKIQ